MMNNKRGAIGIILFFVVLFLILVIGFMASYLIGVFGYASDTVTPVFDELGLVDSVNLSSTANYVVTPVDTFVQALPWIIGFAYIAALIFSIVFAISYTYTANPVFIGLYFMLIVLLILGAIVMSNMYQDIYTGTDEIATKMHEQTMLSYLILYSPQIFTLIAFITGIYLFTRGQQEGGTVI